MTQAAMDNDTMVAVTLKPCPNPWCVQGDVLSPWLIWVGSEAAVECRSCGMQGPSVSPVVFDEDGEQIGAIDAEAEAVAAWNARQSEGHAGALAKRVFVTCTAGDGPTPYLKVHFASLADAHAAHDQLLGDIA